MPIIVKPLNDPGVPGNPLNRPSDGFDPTVPYQMVPLGGRREMVVQTGDLKAELTLTLPDVSSMSDFRIVRQATPNLTPLPGPGVSVRRIALPERATVRFTLAGRSIGFTVLEARDRPTGGAPLLAPSFKLGISVKRAESRQFGVCYLFDRVNRDTGARQDFAGRLTEVDRIFRAQSNIQIVNVDGAAASTAAARTLTLTGTFGRVFDMDDNDLLARVIDGFNAKFPGAAAPLHSVVFPLPVPLRRSSQPAKRFAGVAILCRRRTTGQSFGMLLIGQPSPAGGPSKQGGPQVSQERSLRHTMAHEIGHSLGLDDEPAESPPTTVGDRIKQVNPIFFSTPQLFNLMFPSNFLTSDRIAGTQIEIMHLLGKQFRQLNV